MRKFTDYYRLREAEDISGSISLPHEDSEQEAIKIAWKRYKNQVISFLEDLDDPEITEALKKIKDDGTNKGAEKIRDLDDENDAVMVPKADGSPGLDDEGGGM